MFSKAFPKGLLSRQSSLLSLSLSEKRELDRILDKERILDNDVI